MISKGVLHVAAGQKLKQREKAGMRNERAAPLRIELCTELLQLP